MMQSFSNLIDSATFDGERLAATITDDWMQGRTTYGGLTAALCLETAHRAFPDLPPLRSAMVSFIGPAGGPVTGEARLLRRGKSVTFAEADISADKGLATRCVFAFGAARESRFDRVFVSPPELPDPETCDVFIPEGLGPKFASQFESRLARGARPFAGSKEYDHWIWVRHRDATADGVVALLALADMPPPAVLPMCSELAPISSMTWMINITSERPSTPNGWWLLQSRAENAANGYSSQDMAIWNFDRMLIGTMRQSVAVFA